MQMFEQNSNVSAFCPSMYELVWTKKNGIAMKFCIKDFVSKCDQIRSLIENFIFCA